ncbi:MAG TPA: glutamate-5-semialdehyde dehydrogenase [Dokdonella sp.]|uniref:glutamate-5-semialdehyde dehydrogenase n=1 Tax=Dokdonella sp. TaxID=2291710 RepID=UPI002C8B3665|nr:glutamate-5-semialdehyde dehydrogenase [Dokdonella sp.]HUD42267.1 glutamate-5-semialdehyde dehydrogenase [Dokdonella sp.]
MSAPASATVPLRDRLIAAREAAIAVAALDAGQRAGLLRAMAAALRAAADPILAANAHDVEAAREQGRAAALVDRLRLDPGRLASVADAVEEVAGLPDPVGVVTRSEIRPNGIRVERVRIPLGVIAMIYEARPNVTADAASLCLKAGNAVVLRGGSEARASNLAIVAALHGALDAAGVPRAALSFIDEPERDRIRELVQAEDLLDLVIPRGGEGLIRFVAEHARVPVIKHYKGVCHLYVDAAADLDLALALLIDGKTTRPSACNALETLLVHRDVAAAFVPRALAALRAHGVAVRGCERTRAVDVDVAAADEDDYAAEYLDLILAVRIVDDLDMAIAHIRRYGSDHTEVIATADADAARRFERALRSAVVMINASSRFSDGGELGLGAEIGISTTRLHAYGPMGLEALTIERTIVRGEGQVRHAPPVARG